MNNKVFQDVITYLEKVSNSDEVIDYDEVSKLAMCPAALFQRIFSYVTEVSISEYVRKRRLTLAAIELHNTQSSVLDVALKFGFQSHSAFSRAFREYHGFAPSQAKSAPSFNNYLPINFSDMRIIGGKKIMAEVKKIYYDDVHERLIVGMKRDTTSEMCGALWQEFFISKEFQLVCDLPDEVRDCDDIDDSEGIGFSYDYTDADHFSVIIGDYVKVGTKIPEGLFAKAVPAGCVAHIQIEGNNLEEIIPVAYFLATEAIEKTGRKIDFEHFFWSDIYTSVRYCEPMRRGEKVIMDYMVPIVKG